MRRPDNRPEKPSKKQADRDKGKRQDQSSDDHDLWHHTAATIEPLKRGKARVHPSAVADPVEQAKKPPKIARDPKSTALSHPAMTPTKAATPSPPTSTFTAPPLATFDRNSVRKIRAGRLEIEARVDLHGMRQDEAHAALRAFLRRSQARGLRFVLVITGKGKNTGAANTALQDGERERGILRRNVPRWLDEPDVRSFVVSFATAAIQHGGEGALYVHLRTKDR